MSLDNWTALLQKQTTMTCNTLQIAERNVSCIKKRRIPSFHTFKLFYKSFYCFSYVCNCYNLHSLLKLNTICLTKSYQIRFIFQYKVKKWKLNTQFSEHSINEQTLLTDCHTVLFEPINMPVTECVQHKIRSSMHIGSITIVSFLIS